MKNIHEYHQNSNSSKKLHVLTMENLWVRLLNLSLSLFISYPMLTLSSSSSSAKMELERNLRQASGLISMMKLLEMSPLKGER